VRRRHLLDPADDRSHDLGMGKLPRLLWMVRVNLVLAAINLVLTAVVLVAVFWR
jgi:hypothetical protein